MVHPDRIYAGGPVRAAVRIGFPSGLIFGLFQLVATGSSLRALVQGASFGVLFGAWLAWETRRRWRGSSELASDDRVAVVRAVRRGDVIQDERLADAVIDYADVVRQAQERDARLTWVGVAAAVLGSIIAIGETLAGSTGDAVLFWLLTALLAVNLLWLVPRRRERAVANARRAQLAAQSLSSS